MLWPYTNLQQLICHEYRNIEILQLDVMGDKAVPLCKCCKQFPVGKCPKFSTFSGSKEQAIRCRSYTCPDVCFFYLYTADKRQMQKTENVKYKHKFSLHPWKHIHMCRVKFNDCAKYIRFREHSTTCLLTNREDPSCFP